MAGKPSAKALAWPLFDAIVAQSAFTSINPWAADGSFSPDYGALRKLLAVPILLGAESRSGVPALALDVWVAYECCAGPDWNPTRCGPGPRRRGSSTVTC